MKLMISHGLTATAAALSLSLLGGCSAERAFDNTVDASLFVGKTAVKATAGATKLAVKGTRSVVRGANDDL
ncbi:hypothetical protein ANTHELSMS3_02073 [Antarctobacter heliothermus]|uniref:Lipoprotein n=1 Tax=Antarctobacter heliothermus TaxID=74033 RepID=A0A222E468_9RHOB|nr:hypothetical protein [Antarctobacter heliothermus]ASP20751.1 hypothetical protein ANTHELSMS3_02073 [Antarctobacter heliothermus]